MKEFKIRCSAIGNIMANGKGGLSKTTQSYVDQWIKEQVYGVKKHFSSKYTDKGLEVEDESIDFLAEQLDYGFIAKNKQGYENEYLTGTPDLILDNLIIDVKNSWDMWTFPLLEEEIPNKNYYWQLQGYMALTTAKNAKLVYTLMDTPNDLLNQWTDVPYDFEAYDPSLRIKTFDIKRDDEAIENIYDRVKEIREYINTKKKFYEKVYKFDGV